MEDWSDRVSTRMMRYSPELPDQCFLHFFLCHIIVLCHVTPYSVAMQGLMAYYYDIHKSDSWVELNQCRYNHMGMDVLYRSQPSYRANHPKKGKCRNDLDYCEDCMTTPLDQIYSIHYTQCRKPWNCIGEPIRTKAKEERQNIPEDSVYLDHCMELQTVWHDYRTDLENKLLALSNDQSILDGRSGTYKTNVFQGHCTANGGDNYLIIAGNAETRKRISELYQ
jgi:hypothetical protein